MSSINFTKPSPLITVAVPSFNQGQFLDFALQSIFRQALPVEVFVVDGGSTDGSLEVIKKWEPRLAGWRSFPDGGQAAAINEGIAQGSAPYVCWLNSDDFILDGGMSALLRELTRSADAPFAYGRAWNRKEATGNLAPVWVERFNVKRLELRCIISQPATLIKRRAWDAVGGLDTTLHCAMDYDIWWRIYKVFGPPCFLNEFVAVNREHRDTKTRQFRRRHYLEAIATVKKHNGSVPVKWWLAQPYAVWFKALLGLFGC